jgi:hypothetical protein
MNINPRIWGSHAWIFLHTVALSYPENPSLSDKKIYKDFFYSLKTVLPCEKCSDNFRLHMEEMPIDDYLKNNDTLFEWVIKLNNIVNKFTNGEVLDKEKMKEHYINLNTPSFFSTLSKKQKYTIYGLLGIVVLYFINKKLKIIK